MAKITNKGRTPRAFHIASRGQFVELETGASVECTKDDIARLKGPAFAAIVADGSIEVDAAPDDGDHDDHDDAPDKPKRGRKPKVKPEDAAPQSDPETGSAPE